MAETRNLNGLRGWLILVGIIVILSPLRQLLVIGPTYYNIFTDGSWAALTTPGQPAYNQYWMPILIAEISANAVFLVLWLAIIYLFFSKHRLFPLVFRMTLIALLVFIVIDTFMIQIVLPNEPVLDKDTMKEFARTVIATAIWVPYTFLSKRVQATFVN